MSEAILRVEHVTMQFGGVVAVNDLSLEVNKGEIVALIGPNGAGKTTAFNCITGVYEPTNGRVSFLGQPMVENHPQGKMQKQYLGENKGMFTQVLRPTPDKITYLGIARTFQNIRLFSSLSVFGAKNRPPERPVLFIFRRMCVRSLKIQPFALILGFAADVHPQPTVQRLIHLAENHSKMGVTALELGELCLGPCGDGVCNCADTQGNQHLVAVQTRVRSAQALGLQPADRLQHLGADQVQTGGNATQIFQRIEQHRRRGPQEVRCLPRDHGAVRQVMSTLSIKTCHRRECHIGSQSPFRSVGQLPETVVPATAQQHSKNR